MKSVFDYVVANGDIVHKDELKFPFLDFGYLYGYGLFESIRVENGVPLLLKEHINRMRRGSIILDIPFDYSNENIEAKVLEQIEKNNAKQSILNLYLTPGDRTEDPAVMDIQEPFFLMVNRQWPNYQQDYSVKLELRQESFQKTPLDRFKTLSWVKNVLEKRLSTQADDVLLFNADHAILETSRANVFFVKDRTLYTPKSPVILPGIIRQFIIDNQEKLSVTVKETSVLLHQLADFDEVFLTNSLRGVFFVKSLDCCAGLVSGSVSREIQEKYCELLQIKQFS